MKDAADRIHVVLQFNGLVNKESEGFLNTDNVSESEVGFSGGDGKPGDDGKQNDDKDEGEKIDSHTQSTLIRDRQPVSPGLEGQCPHTTRQKHKQTCSQCSPGPRSPFGTGQLHHTQKDLKRNERCDMVS